MPLARPVVFPLHPILPNGQCGCGHPSCGRIGKHPVVLWRDLALGDEVPRPAPGAGAGIKTGARPKGSGVFVVDLDGPEANEAFETLGPCPDTLTVETPRGWHLYFRHPGFPVKTSAGELGKGIDVRGEGGFVVAPGSPHASGGRYEVVEDLEPAEAPSWLIDWLKKQPAPAAVQSFPGDVSGTEREWRRGIYKEFLEKTPPCVQGAGGDQRLFEVVQYGAYDLALPSEDVLDLVAEHFDHRCQPPWGDELEERVLYKAHSAKTSSTRERRAPLLEAEETALADLLEPTAHPKPLETAPDPDDPDCGLKISWGGWSTPPKPPVWLVDDFLVAGSVSMIFADPGSIKSFTAIDLAACVSSGADWLGDRRVRKGPVLYVDFEDGDYEFHRRVHMLTRGADLPDLGYVYWPGRIDDQAFWSRLQKIQAARGFGLVILDTLAGGTPGVDENDRNAAAPLNYAGPFAEATGASVLVLHHANKSGSLRGTSAFTGAVDTLFKLETLKDEDGTHQARLTCTKSGQKKVAPISLELTDEGLKKFAPPEKESPEEQKKDKRTLDDLQAEVLLLIEGHGPIASLEKIRAHVQAKASAVSAVVAELLKAGEVVKTDAGYVADNIFRAKARVFENVVKSAVWTKETLAKASKVSLALVDRMIAEKDIAPKGSGRDSLGFILLPK